MKRDGRANGVLAAALGAALLGIPAIAVGQEPCAGDCNGNGQVAINELIVGVNIALGSAAVSACEAFDADGNSMVAINELVAGVGHALDGCPSPPVTALEARRLAAAPTGIDDPVWNEIRPFAPTLSNMSVRLLYGDGQLNMSGTFDGLGDFNGGEPANLELRAGHDGESLYILAEWNDVTLNVDRRRWFFDGPEDPLKAGESADGWTSQLNDDKIGFAFEIDAASSEFGSFAEVGCAASCHNVGASGLDMRPASGRVDIWHWKTSRSEPLGYVNDQESVPDPGRRNDVDGAIEHRNQPDGGNNRSGPAFEWDGTPQTFTRWDGVEVTLDPAFVLLDGHRMPFQGDAEAGDVTYQSRCSACHGNLGQGGIGPALTETQFARLARSELDDVTAASAHPGASAYGSLSAEEQTDLLARVRGLAGVPGYYLSEPTGSGSDIVTQSNIDYTMLGDIEWTHYRLLIIRALDTGNDDDAAFVPGSEYAFGVALMDNDGRNHIGARRETLVIAP